MNELLKELEAELAGLKETLAMMARYADEIMHSWGFDSGEME